MPAGLLYRIFEKWLQKEGVIGKLLNIIKPNVNVLI